MEFYQHNKAFIQIQIVLFLGILLHYMFVEGELEDKVISVVIYILLISLSLLNMFFIAGRGFAIWGSLAGSVNKYIKMYTVEEYERIKEETTQKEKEKLFTSSNFEKMFVEKGEDEAKWNWQLRDRKRGRLNVISDDELSNITVSDEEDESNSNSQR